MGPPLIKTHLAAVWSKTTQSYDISTIKNIDLNCIVKDKYVILEDIEKLEFTSEQEEN